MNSTNDGLIAEIGLMKKELITCIDNAKKEVMIWIAIAGILGSILSIVVERIM